MKAKFEKGDLVVWVEDTVILHRGIVVEISELKIKVHWYKAMTGGWAFDTFYYLSLPSIKHIQKMEDFVGSGENK